MSDPDLIHAIQEFHDRTDMKFEDIWNGLSIKVARAKIVICPDCGERFVVLP